MANFKRKRSRYNYRCTLCNSSRFATEQGDLNHKDVRNNDRYKEAKEELQKVKQTKEISTWNES